MSAAEWAEEPPARAGGSQSPNRRVRSLPGGVAALGVAASLWVLSGTVGLIGGGILLVAWAVLPATYVFAVGQLAFVAVTRPESLLDTGLLPLAVVEFGLAGVLVGPALASAAGRRTAMWTVLGGSLLGGIALVSHALWDRLWVAATILLALGSLGAYGLHRYELVVLGKVTDPRDSADSDERRADADASPNQRDVDSTGESSPSGQDSDANDEGGETA